MLARQQVLQVVDALEAAPNVGIGQRRMDREAHKRLAMLRKRRTKDGAKDSSSSARVTEFLGSGGIASDNVEDLAIAMSHMPMQPKLEHPLLERRMVGVEAITSPALLEDHVHRGIPPGHR